MRIAFDINHPADVHTFKNLVRLLNEHGHQTLISVRHTQCSAELLVQNQLSFIIRPSGFKFFNRISQIPVILKFLLNAYKKFKPELLIGGPGNLYLAQLGRLLHIPAIILDDTEHTTIQNWLTFPFATTIWTPQCFSLELGQKQIRFNGTKELAYLHPNQFHFSRKKFETLLFRQLQAEGKEKLIQGILTKEKPLILLRMATGDASHDLFQKGIVELNRIIHDLEQFGLVFLSMDRTCPPEFERLHIQIPANQLHNLIVYSDLVISEGATTAAESAVLGKPTIYCNSFKLGYIDEYSEKYGLIKPAESYPEVLHLVKSLLKVPNIGYLYHQKQQKVLRDKIDVTQWMFRYLTKHHLPGANEESKQPAVYQIAKVDPKHAPAGGIENYVGIICRQLRRKKIPVGFIGVEEIPTNGALPKIAPLEKKREQVHPIGNNDFISVFQNFQPGFATNRRFLMQLCMKIPFFKLASASLLHFHRPDFVLPFAFLPNPKVCTIHGNPGELIQATRGNVFRLVYEILERLLVKRFKYLIFISRLSYEYYQKKFPRLRDRMVYIPTAIAPVFKRAAAEEIIEWRRQYGWSAQDRILMFIGRLEKEKQVSKIIDVFHALSRNFQQESTFLAIVGEGTLRPQIEKKIKQLNDPFIRTLGFIPQAQLPVVYSSADATIIYSMSEGLPGAALESLACGVPVIANRVGDLPLLIRDGENGYLADLSDMGNKIVLALNETAQMTASCMASVKDYQSDFTIQQLIEVYQRAKSGSQVL